VDRRQGGRVGFDDRRGRRFAAGRLERRLRHFVGQVARRRVEAFANGRLEEGAQQRDEDVRFEGFPEATVGLHALKSSFIDLIEAAANQDDFRSRERSVLANAAAELDPREARHIEVREHDRGTVFEGQAKRVLPVIAGDKLEGFFAQRERDRSVHEGRVVRKQNLRDGTLGSTSQRIPHV